VGNKKEGGEEPFRFYLYKCGGLKSLRRRERPLTYSSNLGEKKLFSLSFPPRIAVFGVWKKMKKKTKSSTSFFPFNTSQKKRRGFKRGNWWGRGGTLEQAIQHFHTITLMLRKKKETRLRREERGKKTVAPFPSASLTRVSKEKKEGKNRRGGKKKKATAVEFSYEFDAGGRLKERSRGKRKQVNRSLHAQLYLVYFQERRREEKKEAEKGKKKIV